MLVRHIRLLLLLGAIPLIILFRDHELMIPIVIGYTVFNLLSRFIIIQCKIWMKIILCIGMQRFYISGLILELLVSLLFFLGTYSNFYPLLPFDLRLLIVFTYFTSIVYLDSRKHLFYVSKNYLLHKHVFSIIQWNYKSIDKVYVYPDKIVFVKGKNKLKVGFANDENAVIKIYEFLEPLLGKKLIHK
jgi:hypothetical protein